MTIGRRAAGLVLVGAVLASLASTNPAIAAGPPTAHGWTRPTLPLGPYDRPLILNGVTLTSGVFFAFGYDDLGSPAIISSTDADTWRSTTIDPLPDPGNGRVMGIASRQGRTVAVGSAGGVTSGYPRPCAWLQRPNGTWQASPLCAGTTIGELRQVVATDAGFVALGTEAEPSTSLEPTVAGWVSTDGLSWDRASFPTSVDEILGLVVAGHRIVALGLSSDRRSSVHSSSDGRDWRLDFTFPKGSAVSSIAYGDGQFVASDEARYPWRSADGRHWSVADDGPTVRSVIWNGDGFVATPQMPGAIPYGVDAKPGHPVRPRLWTSDDGSSWTGHVASRVPILHATSIASGGGRTVISVRVDERHELWVGPADLPDTSTAALPLTSSTRSLRPAWWLVVALGGFGGLLALRRGRPAARPIPRGTRPSRHPWT